MANQSGSHGANEFVDLNGFESFQIAMRATFNRQVQAAIADLEAAYQSHVLDHTQVAGVQVSVNVNYNIRLTDLTDTQNHSDEGNSWEVHSSDDHSDEDDPDEVLLTLRSAIFNLLWSLPRPDLEEAQDCPVCREPFSQSPTGADQAIVLKCNHVVGFICIRNWICRGENSCPLCRAAIVEPAALIALADRVESFGLPRPVFRTPALDVTTENEEAAFGEQELFIELTDEERSDAGASQPMDINDSLWDMLASEGEVSDEQFRLIPRVYALLREIRETRERLRTLATR